MRNQAVQGVLATLRQAGVVNPSIALAANTCKFVARNELRCVIQHFTSDHRAIENARADVRKILREDNMLSLNEKCENAQLRFPAIF